MTYGESMTWKNTHGCFPRPLSRPILSTSSPPRAGERVRMMILAAGAGPGSEEVQ